MSLVITAIFTAIWARFQAKHGSVGGLSVLLCISTMFFGTFNGLDNGNSIDTAIKFLFLLSILLQIRKNFEANGLTFVLLVLFIFSFVNAQHALYNRTYSQQDCIYANVTLYTGFFACLCKYSTNDVKKLLRIISELPLVSLVLGLILSCIGITTFWGRFGTSIAGASLSTNLSFFGTIGVASALIHFKCFGNVRFRYLAYLNFCITCSTLTRGGILASSIILLYDIIPFCKDQLKHYKTIVISILGTFLIIPGALYAIRAITQRTAANGDSGRIQAWEYILSLQANSLWGNGYGFLKGRDEFEIMAYSAAHNEYIHLYVELGLIGLFLVATFFFVVLKNAFRFSCVPKLLLMSIFLSFLTYSYTDNTLTNFRFWFPYMILLSLICNCRNDLSKKSFEV